MLLSTVVYVLLSTYYESERVAIDLQSDHYDSELFCLILCRLWKHAVATTSGAMRSKVTYEYQLGNAFTTVDSRQEMNSKVMQCKNIMLYCVYLGHLNVFVII